MPRPLWSARILIEAQEATGRSVLRCHSEQATERPFYTMPGREGTTLLFGQAHSGRYLLAVLAESGEGRWHVVTARSMTKAERRVFKKKARHGDVRINTRLPTAVLNDARAIARARAGHGVQ